MRDKITRILWLDNREIEQLFLNVSDDIDLEEGIYANSTYNYCEYDIVIIDFAQIATIEGSSYENMREEIKGFLNQEKTLFLLNYDSFIELDNFHGYSGSIFFLDVNCTTKVGTKILKKYPQGRIDNSYFRYNTIYKFDKTPEYIELIISNDGNDSVVGFSKKMDNSNIIVVPFYTNEETLNDDLFIKELLIMKDYVDSKNGNNLPDWSNEYCLPKEIAARKEIEDIEKSIEELKTRKEELENIVKEEEKYKSLFTGTGEPLRLLVGEVFEKIGFEVDFHDEFEEDLNIRFNGKRILVEVSGGSKGLKYDKLIRHHGRVVSEKEKDESIVKGLLVINTFKDIPLDERSDKTHFSKENISYSKLHGLCIMTGLTLLNCFLKFVDGKMTAEELFQKICGIDGVLEVEGNYLIKKEQ